MAPVETELATDLAMLDAAATRSQPAFRTWRTDAPTVVVGKAVEVEREVNVAYCQATGTAIVRRESGGRSVWVGPGTLQYAFALPYRLSRELEGIASTKRFCNRLLLAALDADLGIVEDVSGDLVVNARKVGGLALRRVRTAVLLHGTILEGAPLATIDEALRHPLHEPAYRGGRAHIDFLGNLPRLDAVALEARVGGSIADFLEGREL
jgi:lipoate-protein ligase A